jgi:hypothetical protein
MAYAEPIANSGISYTLTLSYVPPLFSTARFERMDFLCKTQTSKVCVCNFQQARRSQ